MRFRFLRRNQHQRLDESSCDEDSTPPAIGPARRGDESKGYGNSGKSRPKSAGFDGSLVMNPSDEVNNSLRASNTYDRGNNRDKILQRNRLNAERAVNDKTTLISLNLSPSDELSERGIQKVVASRGLHEKDLAELDKYVLSARPSDKINDDGSKNRLGLGKIQGERNIIVKILYQKHAHSVCSTLFKITRFKEFKSRANVGKTFKLAQCSPWNATREKDSRQNARARDHQDCFL